jgi:hypothetical protein
VDYGSIVEASLIIAGFLIGVFALVPKEVQDHRLCIASHPTSCPVHYNLNSRYLGKSISFNSFHFKCYY